MQKILLLLLINILSMGISYSQVFVSNFMEGKILLGPDNVSHHNESKSTDYFSSVEAFKQTLNEQEKNLQTDIKKIESKKKIKIKDEVKLNTYKFDIAKITHEKELVNILIESWTNTFDTQKTLLAISLLEDDVCFEINTDKGIYRKDQIEISRVDAHTEKYNAFIPISSFSEKVIEKGGKWVRKKKSPGCVSKNPADCYVACYEKTKVKTISYELESMEGKVVRMNTEPLNMNCKKDMCYVKSSGNKDVKLNLSLKAKDTGEELEIIDWKRIECSFSKTQ